MLTAREAAELRAYYDRLPFDDESQSMPTAQLAAIYTNAHLKDGTEPFPLTDFLPFRPAHPEPESDLDAKIVAFFKDK